ncbi:MAG: endonuclease/exonuclease/phosphatase family protein [Prevotellaceae bacterium]|nr:endonuclease/exonuclease/phosphatase family protein [Prevotellaceae bacterium]
MKFLRSILMILSVAALLLVMFFAILFFMDFKSPKELVIAQNDCDVLSDSVFNILTWNIGYAGLDASMDFFYEGGSRSQQSREKTCENLQKICDFIKSNDTVDFILLQEVDINSKRSYNINEFREIQTAIPSFYSYFSINYNTAFVPVPIKKPTGKILSSLVFCTKNEVCSLKHFAYPNTMKLPSRTFLYDRCFIAARYNLKNGKQLLVINTHNSAFDSGKQRLEELSFLKRFVTYEYNMGNYVIVGGDWNQVPPSCVEDVQAVKNFTAIKIPHDFFPDDWQWFAGNTPTNRYLDKPYTAGQSSTATIDFFLASPNVECANIKVVDLEFANSDHNPVIARFRLNR